MFDTETLADSLFSQVRAALDEHTILIGIHAGG